ncbi:putative tuliposide A-converting enzyme 1, chloroplastic [Iris pallida]|uniref:Tuliposide A-converting enzyme 1, chloroplastic n=1 Tax=Iris pallida TaxID=29817 RepID=A0AAX6GIH5_IRIPA|nr:putative tuliposide A-converting enzyme 1, chloroplastic [Iris pallida]
MDADSQIQAEFTPFFRVYKSGRVERLVAAAATTVPASLDPSPGGVSSKDVTISPNVSARLYLPNNTPADKRLPIVVYYHGGAFCIESAFSPQYHSYACSLSSRANALVVSVEYRLAPEHRLPAAHDDAWEALQWALGPDADEWLVERGDAASVFLAGDSAGANLAHHAASAASKRGLRVEGLVLVHPYFWLKGAGDPNLEGAWGAMSEMDIEDPRHGPMADGAEAELAGLRCRRVMVEVAEKDVLKAVGVAYREALARSGWGGEVELVETGGEGHVFHLARPVCAKGEELMDRVAAFINAKREGSVN